MSYNANVLTLPNNKTNWKIKTRKAKLIDGICSVLGRCFKESILLYMYRHKLKINC